VSEWVEGSLESDQVRRIVGSGYDAMGERFDRWADATVGSPRDEYVRRLFDAVPAGEPVLEIGCGSGRRATGALAERYAVTGIDLSSGQIVRARERIPTATFLVGDVTEIEFEPGSFGGIVAFYMMNHLPAEAHASVYRRVADWLRPGGVFIANLPMSDAGDGVEKGWLGVPMFFSSVGGRVNLELLRAAGLDVVDVQVISEVEVDPDDGSSEEHDWQWIVARGKGTTRTACW
jgi:SAM-dependent methyltransferase